MSFADIPLAEQGKQPYKYNGKELDQMHGLNMYDYSARFYEPAIGRFSTVDPHAEKYYNVSPYAYVSNNPMSFIDPNGMDSIYYQSRYIPTPGKKNIMQSFKITYELIARVGKGGQNVYSVTFSDVVVTPLGGIYTNGGVLTDYHGNVIGEEGLEIVSPEFEALMIGRGLTSMIGGKVVSSMSEKIVAKEATNSLRQVGKLLESVEDVFANPNLLKGQSPAQIEGLLGKTSGWKIETLGRGSHKGQGMILREYGKKGPTGRMIQWHPGGGHHGSKPYWKVSSGVGTHRIF